MKGIVYICPLLVTSKEYFTHVRIAQKNPLNTFVPCEAQRRLMSPTFYAKNENSFTALGHSESSNSPRHGMILHNQHCEKVIATCHTYNYSARNSYSRFCAVTWRVSTWFIVDTPELEKLCEEELYVEISTVSRAFVQESIWVRLGLKQFILFTYYLVFVSWKWILGLIAQGPTSISLFVLLNVPSIFVATINVVSAVVDIVSDMAQACYYYK